jgi:hypothetical protein
LHDTSLILDSLDRSYANVGPVSDLTDAEAFLEQMSDTLALVGGDGLHEERKREGYWNQVKKSAAQVYGSPRLKLLLFQSQNCGNAGIPEKAKKVLQ